MRAAFNDTKNLKRVMENSDHDSDIFEVDRILDHNKKKDVWYYKVRWQGYGSEEDTWEPEENLLTCKDIVDHYWEEKRKNLPKTNEHKKYVKYKGESDLESSVDLDTPAGKRKRGRPPKKKRFLDAEHKLEDNLTQGRRENKSMSSDDEEIPLIVKRRPGRPRKHEIGKAVVREPPKNKNKTTEHKREYSFSLRDSQGTDSNSSEEDIPKKIKRRPGRPRKADADSDLDKDLLALSSPEFSFLLDLDDIAPRGMTRQASKELALVRLRREYSRVPQFTALKEFKDNHKGRKAATCSGDDEVTAELSSPSADIIEISSQSTEDSETRREYIVISSQSESEFEEGIGQGSKLKPPGHLGNGKGLSVDDESSKNERLGSNEHGSAKTEVESQVTAGNTTEKSKEGGSLLMRHTTDGAHGKYADINNVKKARTGEDLPVSGAQRCKNKSRESPDCNSGSSRLPMSTKDDSITSNVVHTEGSGGSTVTKEGNGVSAAEPRDENSNKLNKSLDKLNKLFAGFQRSRGQVGSSLHSKHSRKVDAAPESRPCSGSPSISEETDDVPRGTKGGEKPAQVRGLFERFDQTRRKSAEGVVKNLGREECVNLASPGGDKPSVCKDTQNLHSVNNKRDAEKKIVTAKATRKKLLSEEENETVYGNTGNVVARRPHSRSNGSSLLATQLSVSETVEERLRTSTRARKSRSRSTGALMEGDLLGSIIRGGMQNDGKKTPHEMKLLGNTEAKKGKAITEDTPSLESMMEDISDEELDMSEFEFDLDDFSPENFYENTEVKPCTKKPSSPVVTPLDVPFGTLKQAIKKGDEMTLRRALAAGCDVDKVDGASGMTLLIWAAAAGQDNVVRLLLKNGANGNKAQRNGITALMHASEQGFAETVEILLDSGAHINSQQMTGETALMKAAKKGHADVVDILLRKAPDTRIQSNFDHSALQLALRSQHFEVHSMISEHEKRLENILEVALGKCIGRSGSLRTPPLMPYRCVAPGEAEKILFQFKYLPSRFPQGADVVLFCVKADFYTEDVCMSFSGDNGVRSIVLNGKVQLPVLQGNRSVYVLKPEPENNELCVDTHAISSRLIVCIYPVSG